MKTKYNWDAVNLFSTYHEFLMKRRKKGKIQKKNQEFEVKKGTCGTILIRILLDQIQVF